MEENENEDFPSSAEKMPKVVKKRIELVRSSSVETVRVSARQAIRKAAKASRDNSEEEEEKSKVKTNKSVENMIESHIISTNSETGQLKVKLVKKVDDELEEDFSTPTYEKQESSDLLDELVMDFGDEDLDEDEQRNEETNESIFSANKMVEDIAGEVAEELMDENEEEDLDEDEPDMDYEEQPAEDSDDDYDEKADKAKPPKKPTKPPRIYNYNNSNSKDKNWKYGKLWEFIRDLLKIPRYNPSVIRWELEDEGEFRIVDSSMVAMLWATVKGNEKMNYEKLSRAMRYYYKHKVFEIVPNKRLVYKFGSRAYNWRNQELEKPGAPRVPCPAQGRRRTTWRCGECLRMFQSGREHEVHSKSCHDTLKLPEDQSKKDSEKLKTHLASRSQESKAPPRITRPAERVIRPAREKSLPVRLREALQKEKEGKDATLGESSKPLRQKLTELKSKLPSPDPGATTTEAPIQLTITPQEEGSSPIHMVIHSPPSSRNSEINSMSSKEHEALESLMCLSVERESDKSEEEPLPSPPAANTSSPVQLPVMVSEINRTSAPETPSAPPTRNTVSEVPSQQARTYMVIPNFQVLTEAAKQVTPPSPQPIQPARTKPDKITFLKSSTEKSKTHTILQKRGETMAQQPHVFLSSKSSEHPSDDEVEVVKVVKTPKSKEHDVIPANTLPMSRIGEINLPPADSDSVQKTLFEQTIPPPPSFSDTGPTTMTVNVNQTKNTEELAKVKKSEIDSGLKKLIEDTLSSNSVQNYQRVVQLTEEQSDQLKKFEGGNGFEPDEANSDGHKNHLKMSKEIKINEKYLKPTPLQTSVGTLRMTSDKILDFHPSQSPVVVASATAEDSTDSGLLRSSLIRINPKYKGMLAGSTENIAAKDDAIPSVIELQKNTSPLEPVPSRTDPPMIKVNPKYMLTVNPSYKMQKPQLSEEQRQKEKEDCLKKGKEQLEKQQEKQLKKQHILEQGKQRLIALQQSTGQMEKARDQLDKRAESHQNETQTLSSPNKFKRVAESLMDSNSQPKRSRLTESLDNLRRSAADTSSSSLFSQADTSSNYQPTTIIPRRYIDRIDRITGPVPSLPTILTKTTDSEPLQGLWMFLRALLHNPAHNPKMVNWEILEEGMFRIHNLSEFYNLWRNLKKTDISYDLLTKTLKIYDDRKILHAVGAYRCVYKFGKNAVDWRPRESEIIYIGKKPVPNQATWPNSRFYADLDPKPASQTISASIISGSLPTTLFTLRPLDSSSQLSEMKVLTDNSRIIKTNNFSAKLPPTGSVAISPPNAAAQVKTPLTLKDCTNAMAEIKIESLNDEIKEEVSEVEPMLALEPDKDEADDLELDCKLTLPKKKEAPALLRLPGGIIINLDRGLFKGAEASKALKTSFGSKLLKTTIIPSNRVFKTGRYKVLTRKKHQPRGLMDNPLTVAQLMDTMIPKKLNYILPKPSSSPTNNTLGAGLLGGAEPLKTSTVAEKVLPVTVLEKAQEECSVTLHLPEALQVAKLPSPNSLGHKLPGQVAQMASTISSSSPSSIAFSTPTAIITSMPSTITSLLMTASCSPSAPLPSTVENSMLDERDIELYSEEEIEESAGGPINKNVLRCRNYRDRRKNMLQEQEEEVVTLESFNKNLRTRHDHLDNSIKKLQEYYLDLIRNNKYRCCGENEKHHH